MTTTPSPTTLVTLQGPAGALDVAARSDRPLRDLAAATATTLGLTGPVVAGHYRVGAEAKEAPLDATLAELGALDGDAIVYFHQPPHDGREERR